MRSVIAILLPLAAVACVQVAVVPTSQPVVRQGQNIEVGKLGEASVGDIVFTEFNYVAAKGAILMNDARDAGFHWQLFVQAGANLYEASIAGNHVFCSRGAGFQGVGTAPMPVCFADSRGAGAFDKFGLIHPVPVVFELQPLSHPVPYKIGETAARAGGSKYELLYQGRDQNTVKLAYREYMDDMARPAFHQDLSYSMSQAGPTPISFRSLRLELLEADNHKLVYRLLAK